MFFMLVFSAVPCLVILFYRHPMWLLCLFPITTAIVGEVLTDYLFETGGYFLVPTDALYFFTITTLALHAVLKPKKIVAALKENVFLTLFLALIGLYVLVYMPAYGHSALGEARKMYFFFLVPLLAAVAIETPADLRRFLVAMVWAAVGLAIVGLGVAVAGGSVFRPINAQGALYVGLAALLMLIHRIHGIVLIGPILDKVLLALFSVVAIAAGHRTAWLAIGSGLLLAFWLYGRKQGLIAKLLLVVSIMVGAIGFGAMLFPETGARLAGAFGGILNPQADATASWRIEGWQMHLDRMREDGKLLFGEGLGSYYGLDRSGNLLPSPHSAYVEMILKFGLFGLALYSLLVFKFVRNALAVRKTLGNGPMKTWLEASLLTFAAAHTFCSGYSFEPVMLMFLAVGNSVRRLSVRPIESSASRRQLHSTYPGAPMVIPPRRALRPRT